MKNYLIILAIILLSSCAANRPTTLQYRVVDVDNENTVTLERNGNYYIAKCGCVSLPDSVVKGAVLRLKPLRPIGYKFSQL